MLGISILYNGEIDGFERGFPCFLPDYDAIFHAQKIAKRIVLFSCFTQFGACNEASAPPFLCPLHPKTPPLHPCSVAWNPVSHTPNHHLGCPILPFGVYFRHICAQRTAPMPDLASSFSLQKHVRFLFSTRKSTRLSYCKNIYTLYGKRKKKFLYLCTIISKQTG